MTAVPSLDARNRIPARLDKIKMSGRFFSELCGVSQSDFVKMMNGGKPLTGPQTTTFYEALDALEELTRLLEPLSPRWEDPKLIREFIRTPRFPNLFATLQAVAPASPPKNVNEAWAEFAREKIDECARLDALMESQAKAHEEWMRYFHESQPNWAADMP